jgi:D-arabinose 1-dehydrogenase-like Zn-dependent alcohol dehydrogenase
VTCQIAPGITGITFDGGYADYIVAPAVTLAAMPAGLEPADAAPLMCAGITTFNALRNAGARAGDTVAVLGIGGLGHLGVQYAVKMGMRTIAIARGRDKEALARELGAHEYVDSEAGDPGEQLAKLGGARVILATVTSGKAMSAVLGGLAVGGKLVVLGAAMDPIEVPGVPLLIGRRSVVGWPSGSSIDSQDTLAFSARTGVRSRNQVFPLERAAEAYDLMMSGKARFRVVLTTGA